MKKNISILILLLVAFNAFSQGNIDNQKEVQVLKRNDFIVYNIAKDTIIDGYKLFIKNKNIRDHYITQSFKLNDSLIIENYYPDLISSIKITKDNKVICKKQITKEDLPVINNRFMNLENSVLQDVNFWYYDPETNLFQLSISLYIPNTNFIQDYRINISESEGYSISIIDYNE